MNDVGAENESYRSNVPDAGVHPLVTEAFIKALQPEHTSTIAAAAAVGAVTGHSTKLCTSPEHVTAGELTRRTALGVDIPCQYAAAHEPERTPEAALVVGWQTPEVPGASSSGLGQASPCGLAEQVD